MPNRYSPLPVKMGDKDDGDTVTDYQELQTLPLNLASERQSTGPITAKPVPPAAVVVEVAATGNEQRTESVKPPEREQPALTTGSTDIKDSESNRSNQGETPSPDCGEPAPRPVRAPSGSKTPSRGRGGSAVNRGKTRYDATVGPLTNVPAAKTDLRGQSPDAVRSAETPHQQNRVTVPPMVVAAAGGRQVRPVYSLSYVPVPVEPRTARLTHQLPAVVECPRPPYQPGTGGRRAVAERQVRVVANAHRARVPPPAERQTQAQAQVTSQAAVTAPVQQPQAAPPRQQQFPPVDPSYNLYMAVECHRATAQDEDGDTPLHIALSQEHVDIRLIVRLVELIKLAGKSLDIFNDMRQTPLHIAAITGNPAAARVLVDNGANPNETDRNGQTAMHNVCANPSKDSAATLEAIMQYAQMELDSDKRNYAGFAPMHLSVKNGLHSLTQVLVTYKANVNCPDAKSGWTPLFHAVTNQDAEHVQILLGGNAQVNMQSYSGNTALHVATGRGFTEIVRLLMRYGADMSLRNTHRDTPGMVTSDSNMSNILRGVSSSSPSLGSHGSSGYSSPSPHPQHPPLTNGMLLVPKTAASPQGVQQVLTVTTQMMNHNSSPKKLTERPQRGAGKRERGPRRSSAAKLDNLPSGDQAVPQQQTAPSKTATDDSRKSDEANSDDSLTSNHRVSVIVTHKSLKRLLIERTATDERGKNSKSTLKDIAVPLKKSKTDAEKQQTQADDGEAKKVNGVLDSEHCRAPGDSEASTYSPSQEEPMDLTKPKGNTLLRDIAAAPGSPHSSASSFSVDDEGIKQDVAEEHLVRESDSQKVDMPSQGTTITDEHSVSGTAEEKVAKSLGPASRSDSPKRERKRKKSERLPPKKRK